MSVIQSDVVIVGAGIMGSSAAFFLTQRGISVSLLERDLVGRQASGTNFGGIRRQGRRLDQLELANYSSEIWPRMNELLSIDVEYLQCGHMRICGRDHPELEDRFAEYARDAGPLGLDLELIRGARLRERFPFLSKDVLVGSLSAEDGHANPRVVGPAFAFAARTAGANVVENINVQTVEKNGEDFHVTSDDGRLFSAPVLLITAGAWGPALSQQFGETVPLVPRGPTMSVTEPAPYGIIPSVGYNSPVAEEDIYFRQIPRGNIIIGGSGRGPACTETCRAYVVPENTLSQLKHAQQIVPALEHLNVIRVWSGIEGYLPDGMPVMGPSSHIGGLFYAFGFSGSGFQIGPGVGSLMAELIDTGKTHISIDAFHIKRFSSAE